MKCIDNNTRERIGNFTLWAADMADIVAELRNEIQLADLTIRVAV